MKIPKWLKPFWRLVKPTVRKWLVTRALYLSDDDLDRIAGAHAISRIIVRRLYTTLREQLLEQFDQLD